MFSLNTTFRWFASALVAALSMASGSLSLAQPTQSVYSDWPDYRRFSSSFLRYHASDDAQTLVVDTVVRLTENSDWDTLPPGRCVNYLMMSRTEKTASFRTAPMVWNSGRVELGPEGIQLWLHQSDAAGALVYPKTGATTVHLGTDVGYIVEDYIQGLDPNAPSKVTTLLHVWDSQSGDGRRYLGLWTKARPESASLSSPAFWVHRFTAPVNSDFKLRGEYQTRVVGPRGYYKDRQSQCAMQTFVSNSWQRTNAGTWVAMDKADGSFPYPAIPSFPSAGSYYLVNYLSELFYDPDFNGGFTPPYTRIDDARLDKRYKCEALNKGGYYCTAPNLPSQRPVENRTDRATPDIVEDLNVPEVTLGAIPDGAVVSWAAPAPLFYRADVAVYTTDKAGKTVRVFSRSGVAPEDLSLTAKFKVVPQQQNMAAITFYTPFGTSVAVKSR